MKEIKKHNNILLADHGDKFENKTKSMVLLLKWILQYLGSKYGLELHTANYVHVVFLLGYRLVYKVAIIRCLCSK